MIVGLRVRVSVYVCLFLLKVNLIVANSSVVAGVVRRGEVVEQRVVKGSEGREGVEQRVGGTGESDNRF